jgi:hypothetical protein
MWCREVQGECQCSRPCNPPHPVLQAAAVVERVLLLLLLCGACRTRQQ